VVQAVWQQGSGGGAATAAAGVEWRPVPAPSVVLVGVPLGSDFERSWCKPLGEHAFTHGQFRGSLPIDSEQGWWVQVLALVTTRRTSRIDFHMESLIQIVWTIRY
jgi:hypothetical protein